LQIRCRYLVWDQEISQSVGFYTGLSSEDKVHWSANIRKIAGTERLSVDAGMSWWTMLKWHCQAVHCMRNKSR